MKIVFKNETELVDKIMESGVDIKEITLMLLFRLGVEPGKMIRRKLGELQQKRSTERDEFETWEKTQRRVFSTQDVIDAIPFGNETSPLIVKEHFRNRFGNVKRGTLLYSDVRYYNGEYYFNDGGCQMATYLLYHKGVYNKDDMIRIRQDLGIA